MILVKFLNQNMRLQTELLLWVQESNCLDSKIGEKGEKCCRDLSITGPRNIAGVPPHLPVRFSSNHSRARRYTFYYNYVRLSGVPRGASHPPLNEALLSKSL